MRHQIDFKKPSKLIRCIQKISCSQLTEFYLKLGILSTTVPLFFPMITRQNICKKVMKFHNTFISRSLPTISYSNLSLSNAACKICRRNEVFQASDRSLQESNILSAWFSSQCFLSLCSRLCLKIKELGKISFVALLI